MNTIARFPRTCRPREAGMVNLIAVLFLGTGILAVLATVVAMNASSITDSARLSRSVQALLLAESGVERTVRRLSDGTACAGLAEASVVQGTGTISIASPVVIGGNCQFLSSGTIPDVNGDVTRTVQVVVAPGSSTIVLQNGAFSGSANWTVNASMFYTGLIGNPAGSMGLIKSGNGAPTAGSVQQTLSTPITTTSATVYTLTFHYNLNGSANLQMSYDLISSTGTVYSSPNTNITASGGWVTTGTANISVPAGVTITTFRINYRLVGSAGVLTLGLIDNVAFSGGTAGSQIVSWHESVSL